MIKLTKEQEQKYNREKYILNNKDLWWACDVIKNKSNETVLDSIFNNNMKEKDIIKYAKIFDDNKLAFNIEELDSKFKCKNFSKYFTLEDVQKFFKTKLGVTIPISVIVSEITCISENKNHVAGGEAELFLNLNFRHDEKKNGGDFFFNEKKFEIKTYEGRLRGNSGFGSLVNVRQSILNYLNNINNNQIKEICKKNTKNDKGHLEFFPIKLKRGGKKYKFLLPEVYKLLNKKEQKSFRQRIVEDFKQLYINVKEVDMISKLEEVVDMMLTNDLNHITDTWKNFNLEYYWKIENCSYFILFDKEIKRGVGSNYKGFYITNDVEQLKQHTDVIKYPKSNNKASTFDVAFAIGYKE